MSINFILFLSFCRTHSLVILKFNLILLCAHISQIFILTTTLIVYLSCVRCSSWEGHCPAFPPPTPLHKTRKLFARCFYSAEIRFPSILSLLSSQCSNEKSYTTVPLSLFEVTSSALLSFQSFERQKS